MSFKKALIIGSTGMLGQSFNRICKKMNIDCLGASRNNNDYNIDLRNEGSISKVILNNKFDLVINCAAIVSLPRCEDDKYSASRINDEVVGEIASACSAKDIKLIHISTDHYYTNDGRKLHNETDKIHILNNYAKTKRNGEIKALKYSNSLVIRTNVTGVRGISSNPTFIEWVYKTLLNKDKLNVFVDFFTSTIDANSCADYALRASNMNLKGLLNISSSDCLSKKEFIFLFADLLNINLNWASDSSVRNIKPKRAESLGLDSSKAERLMKLKMPSSETVIKNLIKSLQNKEY